MSNMIYADECMRRPELLPLLKSGIKTHYEGSIDKRGGNADYDWWLYQDGKGEWVLFDCVGPGCILNFVQHRYPDSSEPTFRFYFDGEDEPRFVIRHSQFGEVYPFVEPLASRYIGPVDRGRGPIRVVRSFVPMPFAKSCRITSDIRLEGYDRAKGHGGWGHVVYQTYPQNASAKTFCRDDSVEDIRRIWKESANGGRPLKSGNEKTYTVKDTIVGAGESAVLFRGKGQGCITGFTVDTDNYNAGMLSDLWIEMRWDGHSGADVCAPFGALFTNELGYNSVRYMFSGMTADGHFYLYLPMPYEKSAEISIINRGELPVKAERADIITTEDFNGLYTENPWGYFRTSDYYPRRHTEGSDSIIASVNGMHGNIIGSVITAHAEHDEDYASCEGDVRVHFDGIRTPQIESDGSESYSCYGWGFPTPPECNPASGYDGYNHRNWSMTRWLPGDEYPFYDGFRFGIESGGNNDCYLTHSGIVFMYSRDGSVLRKVAGFSCGDEELTSYFEGDDDGIPVTACGCRGVRQVLRFEIPENTEYVMLRRMSDQMTGRQRAAVYINGTRLPFDWYFADRNEYKRWLEDEYMIPASYLNESREAEVVIEPVSENWNTFGVTAFAVLKQ